MLLETRQPEPANRQLEARRALRALAVTLATLLAIGIPLSRAAAQSYLVDVLVFEELGFRSAQAATIDASLGPDPLSASAVVGGAGTRGSPARGDGSVIEVNRINLPLAGARAELGATRSYRPLLHVGWRQPRYFRTNPQPVGIGDRASSPVYGVVNVSRGRFVHVELDIMFRHADGLYRIQGRRKIRTERIHYFDHPAFGVLIQVSRQ